MTTVVAAFVLGLVPAVVVWTLTRAVFSHPTLARRNVRGIDVPTAGGVVIVVALLPGWMLADLLLVHTDDVVSYHLAASFGIVTVTAVFAFLGIVDDVLASGPERGFRGHLGALFHGRFTTGGLKLVGGGLVALVLAAGAGSLWEVVVDGAVIALAANTANLFDRAPGRVTKVSSLALVLLLATASGGERHQLAMVALVVGAAAGLLVAELREQVMLGDTGANPLGAVIGLGLVTVCGTVVTVAVLAVLVALNVASEKVSFSEVIDRTPPLRWLDQLGRAPE
ncbi:MAG: hypothetical protein JJE52_01170 [Acidimicrobiia bacterium]|nr:hypothetical protein [Acidimicrobiia bacterium]